MTKLTFQQKVSNLFLNEQERSKLDKARKKEQAIEKLLNLHDCFQDALLQTPLNIILKRIEDVEKAISDVDAWLNDGEKIEIVKGKDSEGRFISETYDKKIGILVDKGNGISERLKEMVKELKSSTEDALDIIHSKRTLLGGDALGKDEISLQESGKSWTDIHAERNKKS